VDRLYRLNQENHVDRFQGNGNNQLKLYNAQLVKKNTREKIPIVFGRHLNNSSSKTRHILHLMFLQAFIITFAVYFMMG
jgi:hypothetical protein